MHQRFGPVYIAPAIAGQQLVDGVPTADVVPSNVAGGKSPNLASLLDHRVIDRDVLTTRKAFLQFPKESRIAERRKRRNQSGCLRKELAQGVEHDRGFPKEHSGVPVEVASSHEPFGRRKLRLLAEFSDRLCAKGAGLDALSEFNVTVPRLGPARLDAEHDDLASLRRLE